MKCTNCQKKAVCEKEGVEWLKEKCCECSSGYIRSDRSPTILCTCPCHKTEPELIKQDIRNYQRAVEASRKPDAPKECICHNEGADKYDCPACDALKPECEHLNEDGDKIYVCKDGTCRKCCDIGRPAFLDSHTPKPQPEKCEDSIICQKCRIRPTENGPYFCEQCRDKIIDSACCDTYTKTEIDDRIKSLLDFIAFDLPVPAGVKGKVAEDAKSCIESLRKKYT